MNNNVQLKAKCKIVGYSIICLILMIACMSCESQERNQELEKERLKIDMQINRAKEQLNTIAERYRKINDNVTELEIIKKGNIPIYKVTLLIKHITKRPHECEIDVDVSKEQYDKLSINQKIKLSNDNNYAFEIVVKNKVITN